MVAESLVGPPPRRRRAGRDRHGRGQRGPLALPGPLAPNGVPVTRTRAERFDDLVLDAVEDLERRFATELDDVEFVVEDVPPPPGPADVDLVPLGATLADDGNARRIVVYRRPTELRAGDPEELADLVHDVVVEQVADLLGLNPEQVDPGYDGD